MTRVSGNFHDDLIEVISYKKIIYLLFIHFSPIVLYYSITLMSGFGLHGFIVVILYFYITVTLNCMISILDNNNKNIQKSTNWMYTVY